MARLCEGLEPEQWVLIYLALIFLILAMRVADKLEVRKKGFAGVRDACAALAQTLANWQARATADPLKQGLLGDLESPHCVGRPPLHLDAGAMIQACETAGIVDGAVEASCLAALLLVQCRRRGGTCRVGIPTRGVEEVELEQNVSFAALVRQAAEMLKAKGSSDAKAEVLFAFNRSVGALEEGETWTIEEDGAQLTLRGASMEEEKSYELCWQACSANIEMNVWHVPVVSQVALATAKGFGKAPKDFAASRDAAGQLTPVPCLVARHQTEAKGGCVAVEGEGFQTTYRELFARAALVKHALLQQVDAAGSRAVLLCMSRGEWVASAFLGILASGLQVVPVDVHWPQERIEQVAAECGAKVALVEGEFLCLLENTPVKAFVVDSSFYSQLQTSGAPTELEVAELTADQVALILFTSGSSGKPKGILLSHSYLSALALGIAQSKRMDEKTRTLSYHSPTWMPFLDYLFCPLIVGGCCLFFPDKGTHIVKPTDLVEFATKYKANQAGFVPAVLDLVEENGVPATLSDVGCGGAAVPAELMRRVITGLKPRPDGTGPTCYTGYSGTEVGDVTMVKMYNAADVDGGAVASGFMSGGCLHTAQSVVLLDAGFNPVGPGGIGEITIAGPGIASGYLNLPEKTAETFLPACAALEGRPAVRSGDLGKWTEGGNLLVVGRRDTMVKVRGARIELGEVEGTISAHKDVKACCITVLEDKLVAYVVPAVPGDLRDYCKARLVAYMVPHVFQGLEELPKLPNGKVNKKLLPKPEERADGAEEVMELDSLGQMRKFTRRAVSEDRVLDNVRAILIGLVLQSHATPIIEGSSTMWSLGDNTPLDGSWGPWQISFLNIARSGGWSSLAFLSGFDDTRAMRPFGLTYREPLFILLWVALGFNWTMWYLPVFAIMRAVFCLMHHLNIQRLHILIVSQIWIFLPAFVDFYIGWVQSPDIPGALALENATCPSQCFCPWKSWPWAQNFSVYAAGWWVWAPAPSLHSYVGHALIFIPCYWIGHYLGAPIFKVLTKIADEPSLLRRTWIAGLSFLLYFIMYLGGSVVVQDFNDRCSAYWDVDGSFKWIQVLQNVTYYVFNLSGSLLWVLFIASAVPVHLKYLAKVCFASLLASGLWECPLDTPKQVLVLRAIMPASISPAVELVWTMIPPFLFELVVGAVITTMLPILIKPCLRVASKMRKG
nr:nonribosomal peptide synthetase 2016 [Ostreopsis cf. ovata]